MAKKSHNRAPVPDHKEMLESLYKHATEGILISDEQGIITDANPAIERLFGYSKQELIGKTIEMLVPDRFQSLHINQRGGFYKNPHPRAMGGGMELFARRKDSIEFPVEISLSTFTSDDRLFVVSFIIDITKRKEQDDALRVAHKQLQQFARELAASNRELEEFAYVASHDLQEPLRKIQAFGDRMKAKEEKNLSGESIDYLQRMLNAASRMQRLINDLLLFSRVTTRAKSFEKVILNDIIREVLSDIEISIEKSKAVIQVSELPVVSADKTQMRQLFQNLISNALKFRKENTGPVIKIYPGNPGGPGNPEEITGVQITVEDNGIGFDEKYTDRIFNIFQRLEPGKFEGTGIGLAVCKKIIERHNGQLTVRSRPGQGSKFIVTLPVLHS